VDATARQIAAATREDASARAGVALGSIIIIIIGFSRGFSSGSRCLESPICGGGDVADGAGQVAGRLLSWSFGGHRQPGGRSSQGIAKKHTPNATVIDIRHLAN